MLVARDMPWLCVFAAWITMMLHFVFVDASEQAAGSAEEEAALREKLKAADDKARESIEKSEASNANFIQNFQNLQKTLEGWKAKIAADGADADPALTERVAGLEKDLKDMAAEYMQSVGTEDLRGPGQAPKDQDVYGPLYGCLALSVKSLGQHRAVTQKALRMLAEAEGQVVASALAKHDLWRMVSVCISSFTDAEYSEFKAGKLEKLPAAYVEAASSPEAEQKVQELSAPVWKAVQTLTKQMMEKLQGEQASATPPLAIGMLALIPVGLGIFFLFRLFRDMRRREEEKKAKKEKRDSKKSK